MNSALQLLLHLGSPYTPAQFRGVAGLRPLLAGDANLRSCIQGEAGAKPSLAGDANLRHRMAGDCGIMPLDNCD